MHPRRGIGPGCHDDLPERHRRGPLGLRGALLVPELAHLPVGRVDRLQLALLPQELKQPVSQDLAPLLLGQEATPLFDRREARQPELRVERRVVRVVAPNAPHRLLDRLLHLLVRDLDGGVPLGLLNQDLVLDDLQQDLLARGGPAGRIGRHRLALRLGGDEHLLDLRLEDRLAADDRHDAVEGPRPPAPPRRLSRRHSEGQQRRTGGQQSDAGGGDPSSHHPTEAAVGGPAPGPGLGRAGRRERARCWAAARRAASHSGRVARGPARRRARCPPD